MHGSSYCSATWVNEIQWDGSQFVKYTEWKINSPSQNQRCPPFLSVQYSVVFFPRKAQGSD